MSAEFCGAAAGAAVAMELGVGDVMGLQQQGIAITAPSPRDSDLGLLKRAALTQAAAAAAAPYPSPFLDEQKMLRFSKAAHTLPSGLDFGGPSEQAFLLSRTKRPFTPSQWMELEHQALIYKYLNAKAPIPSSRGRGELVVTAFLGHRIRSNLCCDRPLTLQDRDRLPFADAAIGFSPGSWAEESLQGGALTWRPCRNGAMRREERERGSRRTARGKEEDGSHK